jgi:uncharacterized protein (TIGR00369 family)
MGGSSADDPDRIARLQSFTTEFFDRHEFLSWIGLSLEELESGHVVLSVPFEDRLMNPDMVSPGDSTFHGGVTATVIDTAGGTALRSTFDEPTSALLTTIDLKVTYLRAVTGDITCTTEVVRSGGSIGVIDAIVECDVEEEEGPREVAVGRGIYRLFRSDSYGLG